MICGIINIVRMIIRRKLKANINYQIITNNTHEGHKSNYE